MSKRKPLYSMRDEYMGRFVKSNFGGAVKPDMSVDGILKRRLIKQKRKEEEVLRTFARMDETIEEYKKDGRYDRLMKIASGKIKD